MNKLFALTFIAFLTAVSFGQNQPQRYMFTGTLLNAPTVQADCNTEATAVVYEFSVTMISDNNYTDQNIAILVKCPESYGAGYLKAGVTYKMEIFDSNGGTPHVIANPTVLDQYNLSYNYWAGDISIVH